MKIICATDFTPRGQAAVQVAVELARRTSGEVELFHVLASPPADILALSAGSGFLQEEVRSDIEGRLAEACARLSTPDIPVTFQVSSGDVEPALIGRARVVDADLIVTGAHSRSVVRRLLLGSVSEGTVRLADRPILVVPSGVDGFGGRDGALRPLSVIVAADGRSNDAIAFVHGLRAHVPCDVTFLRLYWPMEEVKRLGLTGPRDLFEPDAQIVADLERSLRMEVGELPGIGSTSYLVKPSWGDPAAAILEFGRLRGADLMVVGAESRRGWARLSRPAVAERIARELSGIPVVFVPAAEVAPRVEGVPALFTVLAPTDLSAVGNRAVPFAYGLLAHGGVIELCYVHERPLPSPAFAYQSDEGMLSPAERERIEAELRALVPAEAQARGITTHVTVIDGGHAGEAIVQAAERLVVDAVVLGSHGRGAARRLLLGSVSQAVVQKSRRPVMIIPSERP